MGLRNRGKTSSQPVSPLTRFQGNLHEFRREWEVPVDQAPRFIVNICGKDGSGKSSLLDLLFKEQMQDDMTCRLGANFEPLLLPVDAIRAIVYNTRHNGERISLPDTEKLLDDYQKIVENPPSVGFNFTRGVTNPWLEPAESSDDALDNKDQLASIYTIQKRMGTVRRNLLQAPLRTLTRALIEELNARVPSGTRLAIAFDNFDKIPSVVEEWLVDVLLGSCGEDVEFDLRIIIVSREFVGDRNPEWLAEWAEVIQRIYLSPLTRYQTENFIRINGDPDNLPYVPMIHTHTGGLPLWLNLWVNSGLKASAFFNSEEASNMNEMFLAMLTDHKHLEWLLDAALLRYFDKDLLSILLKDSSEEAFDWLAENSSLVERHHSLWKVHDIPRAAILRNLYTYSHQDLERAIDKLLAHFTDNLSFPWKHLRKLEHPLQLTESDKQHIADICYYSTLRNGNVTSHIIDILLRSSDDSPGFCHQILNHILRAFEEVDEGLPDKLISIREIILQLNSQEHEIDAAELIKLLEKNRLSKYQEAILRCRIAEVYEIKLDDSSNALKQLKLSLEAAPSYYNALGAYARLMLSRDQDRSIKAAETLLSKNANDAEAFNILAVSHARREAYGKAADYLKKITLINPEQGLAFYNWGIALTMRGDWQQAVEKLSRAQSLDRTFEGIADLVRYNQETIALKRAAGSSAARRTTITADVVEAPVEKKGAVIQKDFFPAGQSNGNGENTIPPAGNGGAGNGDNTLSPPGENSFQTIDDQEQTATDLHLNPYEVEPPGSPLLEKAVRLTETGNHQEAIKTYQQAQKENPKNGMAYDKWAMSLIETGNHQEALEKFALAMEENPENDAIHFYWALTLARSGHHEAALGKYQKAAEADSRNEKVYFNWGMSLSALGFHKQATEKFHKADKLAPGKVETLIQWAMSLTNQGHHGAAVKKYREAEMLGIRDADVYFQWGFSLGQLKQMEEAIDKFKSATELEPEHAEAYFQWGLCLLKLKLSKSAIERFQKTITINPEHARAFYYIGLSMVKLNDHKRAIQMYRKAAELRPDMALAHQAWGNCLAQSGEHEEAIACLNRALEINEKLPGAYNSKGISLAHLKRYEEALPCFEAATTLNPNLAIAYYHWGMSLAQLGQHGEAVAKYSQALKLNQKLHGVYYFAAFSLAQMGKHDEAIAHYRSASRLSPNSASLYNDWGEVLMKTGSREEAVEKFEKAIEIKNEYPAPHRHLGIIYFEQKRYEEAARQFHFITQVSPDATDAYINLAKCLVELERFDEAQALFENVDENHPEMSVIYNRWGLALSQQGRNEEALRQFQKATELNPEFAAAYTNWGNRLADMGRHEEAIEMYRKVIELSPNNSTAYNNWGNRLADMGQHLEAIEKYAQATKLNPDNASAFFNWGSCLADLGRFEEATQRFKDAIKIDESNEFYWAGIGWHYFADLKDYSNAIDATKKALLIDDKAIWIRSNLALAMLFNGQYEVARREYTDILQAVISDDYSDNEYGRDKIMLIKEEVLKDLAQALQDSEGEQREKLVDIIEMIDRVVNSI